MDQYNGVKIHDSIIGLVRDVKDTEGSWFSFLSLKSRNVIDIMWKCPLQSDLYKGVNTKDVINVLVGDVENAGGSAFLSLMRM